MTTKDTSEPAFPAPDAGESDYGSNNRGAYRGLTVRDYFAAKALQGILSDVPKSLYGLDHVSKITAAAFEYADAMLLERSK